MSLFNSLINIMFEDSDKVKKPRKSLSDIMFEDADKSNEHKRSLMDILFEDDAPDVEFADTELVEDISNSIKEKIQDKKRELTMLGRALRTIKIEDFPKSGDVLKEYLELVEEINNLQTAEQGLDDEDVVQKVSLERSYSEFEKKYEERIPRIKTLFFLREMRLQNSKLKSDFNKKLAKDITEDELNEDIEYIRKISEQQSDFSKEFRDDLIQELIIAEYRVKMLMLMRQIYIGEESNRNPFSSDSKDKKKKFGEVFLEDIEEADKQYQRIINSQSLFTKTGVLPVSVFTDLDADGEELNKRISNGLIDDFSIEGVFENDEYDALKMFINFKIKMNEIESKYDKAREIDMDNYLKSQKNSKGKKGKKPSNFGDDSWQLI